MLNARVHLTWFINNPHLEDQETQVTQKAQVTHLTRCSSDHCPILLELQPQATFRLNRPFRFQSFWLSDETFLEVVQ